MGSPRRDRQDLQILSLQECLELIDLAPVGRIAYVNGGQPTVIPVNHRRDGMRIAFRSASGGKHDAAMRGALVAFEVDGHDEATRTGWSVIGHGRASVADPITASHLERLEDVHWATGVSRPHWIVIDLRRVSGRRIDQHLAPRDGAAHASRMEPT